VFETLETKGKSESLHLQINHFKRANFAGFNGKSGWLCGQHCVREEKPLETSLAFG